MWLPDCNAGIGLSQVRSLSLVMICSLPCAIRLINGRADSNRLSSNSSVAVVPIRPHGFSPNRFSLGCISVERMHRQLKVMDYRPSSPIFPFGVSMPVVVRAAGALLDPSCVVLRARLRLVFDRLAGALSLPVSAPRLVGLLLVHGALCAALSPLQHVLRVSALFRDARPFRGRGVHVCG